MAFNQWREPEEKSFTNPFAPFIPSRNSRSDYTFQQTAPSVVPKSDYTPSNEIQEAKDPGLLAKTFDFISPAISGRSALDAFLPGDPGTDLFNKLAESDSKAGTWAAIALDALLAPITLVEAGAFITGVGAPGAAASTAARTAKTVSGIARLREAKVAQKLAESKKFAAARKVSDAVVGTSVPKGVASKGKTLATSYILGRNVSIDAAVTGALSTERGKKLAENNPSLAAALGLTVGVAAFGATDIAAKTATSSTMEGLLKTGRLGVKDFNQTPEFSEKAFSEELGKKIGASEVLEIKHGTADQIQQILDQRIYQGQVSDILRGTNRIMGDHGLEPTRVVYTSGWAGELDMPYVSTREGIGSVFDRPLDTPEQVIKAMDDTASGLNYQMHPLYLALNKMTFQEIFDEATHMGIETSWPAGGSLDFRSGVGVRRYGPKNKTELVERIFEIKHPEVKEKYFEIQESQAKPPFPARKKDIQPLSDKVLNITVNDTALDELWDHIAQIENPNMKLGTGVDGEQAVDVFAKYKLNRSLFPDTNIGGRFRTKEDLQNYLVTLDVIETNPNMFDLDRNAVKDPVDMRNMAMEIFENIKNDGKQVDFQVVNQETGLLEVASAIFPNLTLFGKSRDITNIKDALRSVRSLVSQSLNPASAMKDAYRASIKQLKDELLQETDGSQLQLINRKSDPDWLQQVEEGHQVSNYYLLRTKDGRHIRRDANSVHAHPEAYLMDGFLTQRQAEIISELSILTRNAADLPSLAGAGKVIPSDVPFASELRPQDSISAGYDAAQSGNIHWVPEVIDAESLLNSPKYQEKLANIPPEDIPEAIRAVIGSDGSRFHTYGRNLGKRMDKEGSTGASRSNQSDSFRPDGLIHVMRKTDELINREYIDSNRLQGEMGVRVYDPWESAEIITTQSTDLFVKRHVVNQALRTTDGSSREIDTILNDLDFAPSNRDKIDNYLEIFDEPGGKSNVYPVNRGVPVGANVQSRAGARMINIGVAGEGVSPQDANWIRQYLKPSREKPDRWWLRFADKANTFGVYVATTIDVGGTMILAPYALGSKAGAKAMAKAFGSGIKALMMSTDNFDKMLREKQASAAYRIASSQYGVRIMDWQKPKKRGEGGVLRQEDIDYYRSQGEDLIPKSAEDFTLGDLPDWVRNAPMLPKFGESQLRFGSFEQAFITMMNDVRVSGAIAEGTFAQEVLAASGSTARLTGNQKRGIGEAWNLLTAVPDATKRGDVTRYLFFADGFFRSQRQALEAALSSEAPVTGAIIRNQMLNVVGAGLTVSALTSLAAGRDPRDVLNPLDEKALDRGEVRINPNLGTVRLGEFDVDTLGWLKPFGAMTMSFWNTGVDVLDNDEDRFYNELLHGVSRFIDSKGSPVVRLMQEATLKGGYDFDGRPILQPVDAPGGTVQSWANRLAPIWASQSINEWVDEMKEAGVDNDITAAEYLAAGVDSILIGGSEALGLRVNPISPSEKVREIVLADNELNPFKHDYKNLSRTRKLQFEQKYPGPFERYKDFERNGAFPSIQMRGWVAVEERKAQLEKDISELWEIYSDLNQGAFRDRAEFVREIQNVKRIAAQETRNIRERHGIDFTPSGYAGQIMNEYYRAFDESMTGRGGRPDYELVDAAHADLEKRILAGEFGGDNPKQKQLNIELFNERIFTTTGTPSVDVIMRAKQYVSQNSTYYEVLDEWTRRLGRGYESVLGTGPISNYTQLTRELGYLDEQLIALQQYPAGQRRTGFVNFQNRLKTARKLKYQVDQRTGNSRDAMRKRDPLLDENLKIIGK